MDLTLTGFLSDLRNIPFLITVILVLAVVFVNGCFWHMHEGCPWFVMPSSNQEYWTEKLRRNRQRDTENQEKLMALGWRVIVVWECHLKKSKKDAALAALAADIKEIV